MPVDKDKPQPPISKDEEPFVDHQPAGSPVSLTKTSGPRPKLAGLFALLEDDKKLEANKENISVSLTNPTSPAPLNEFSNLFDTSAQLELPSFPPSGLDFDLDAQSFGSTSFDMSVNDVSYLPKRS